MAFPKMDNRKAHPDEKGTESYNPIEMEAQIKSIAKPIPMKRELKEDTVVVERREIAFSYRKAHPDEKGTERSDESSDAIQSWADIAKPIPMKRELKDLSGSALKLMLSRIAKPIPMKRELKEYINPSSLVRNLSSQSPSR